MSLFDPQSDPEYCAHECRECDQPMQKEFPRVRNSGWICVNHSCKRSPFFESVVQAEKAAELLGGALEVLLDEIGTPEPDAEIVMLEARALEIEEALQDPFIRAETANVLLDELAGIDAKLAPFGSARWFEGVPEIPL